MATIELNQLSQATSQFHQSDLTHLQTQVRACDGVCDVIIAVRNDRPSERNLVLYLTTEAGVQFSVVQFKAQLARLVRPGLMPTTMIVLDHLPRTANGAADLSALPAPASEELGTRLYEAPFGPVEKAIAAIWQDLLNLEIVGRQANFFELGGNSALVVQLIYRLRQQLEVQVNMRDLFQAPLLHDFAAQVSSRILLLRYPFNQLTA